MTIGMTPALVQRLIERLFAEVDWASAIALLADHAAAARHPEVVRVQIAALKLSEGTLEKLRQAIKDAHVDYRDVLAWAEYPAQMHSPVTGLSTDQKTLLISADHAQYDVWLRALTEGAT